MTFRVVPREEWGAAAPTGGLSELRYPVGNVFLHHEAGAPIYDYASAEQECARMREIQGFCQRGGYTDFPYGVAVFPSGRIYEGRDLGFVGVGNTAQEAATAGNNSTSIAIVWPGNYDIQQPTQLQIDASAWVIQLAKVAGVLTSAIDLRGHRDVYPTACPGKFAYGTIERIRLAMQQKPQGPSTPTTPPVKPSTPVNHPQEMNVILQPRARKAKGALGAPCAVLDVASKCVLLYNGASLVGDEFIKAWNLRLWRVRDARGNPIPKGRGALGMRDEKGGIVVLDSAGQEYHARWAKAH